MEGDIRKKIEAIHTELAAHNKWFKRFDVMMNQWERRLRWHRRAMLLCCPFVSFWIGKFWPLGFRAIKKVDGTGFILVKCGVAGFLIRRVWRTYPMVGLGDGI